MVAKGARKVQNDHNDGIAHVPSIFSKVLHTVICYLFILIACSLLNKLCIERIARTQDAVLSPNECETTPRLIILLVSVIVLWCVLLKA